MMEASIYFQCDAQTVDDYLCVCIQFKCPIFLERHVHFVRLSLEALSTRKPLTTSFLAWRTVDGRGGHSAQHDGGLRKLKCGPKVFQDVDP